mmetsp:Transcript_1161/g.2911  ORF Transcript_1161/g.2911 Transcript_1161/m.2911 type:complete len:431 (-) Transcript_1161:190-1482(-)
MILDDDCLKGPTSRSKLNRSQPMKNGTWASRWLAYPSDVPVEQLLQVLLLSTLHGWVLGLLGVLRDLLEAGLARRHLLGEGVFLPRNVARVQHLLHETLLHQLGRAPQASCDAVHAPDVCEEHVLDVGALAAELAIKVVASGGNASLLDDDEHAQESLPGVRRKLIGVPAKVRLPCIAVDRPEHPAGRSHAEVVLVVVARQGGVVGLNVELELLLEPIAVQEPNDGLSIVVILVRHRLAWLGLDTELCVETDFLLVVHSHPEECCHVVHLISNLGVERRHEALTSTPENVVGGTQFLANIQHFLRLSAAIREGIKVRSCGSTILVPVVREKVLRAPQEFDAGLLLFPQQFVRHDIQVLLKFLQRVPLRRHVQVVEAVVVHAQLLEKLEGDVNALQVGLQRATPIPRPQVSFRVAEGICAHLPIEGMPPSN